MLKIKHFEFWNTHIFHLPIYLYWLYLSFKARSLFFFQAANPGIETGGLLGESKYKILQKIDPQYLPKTLFYANIPAMSDILYELMNENMTFPFVVKPDIGQGGWMIEMIHDCKDLKRFLSRIRMPFIVQEYVDYPIELGLLYYRFPGNEKGTISSIAVKELLCVTGDGALCIKSLMRNHPRAKGQLAKLLKNTKIDLKRIPAKGERVPLSFIGNHSYGTMFLNGNNFADAHLTTLFDGLCKRIEGFYFGRFDLRCESMEDLKSGKFKILELNGVGSEPLHIFDPSEKLWNAYISSFQHWNIIYRISMMNKKTGICYMRLKEAWDIYKHVRRIQQIHNTNFTIGN